MKKIMTCFLLLLIFSAGYAENIIINNKSTYPIKNQKSKIAIQWAARSRDVQEANKALIYGLKLDKSSLQAILRSGEINLTIPNHAQHFRVLVWSKGTEIPDLLTNWVDVVPNKSYTLEKDQLSPAVLMSGAGC